ncbi:hypothetical protein MF672_016920 [Actinomadura sp. ATCC 31491]|uniref:Uncharacterized protein n=1 Tax=Actinomadura luzonensis TaxID=2805427 RepID=A0ABT0FT65_9ACTN|nr:hypothetical protein [Actinomadura luzonensis]MCK2215459.1 hypothetical protein [Actinomadura luzonensis]
MADGLPPQDGHEPQAAPDEIPWGPLLRTSWREGAFTRIAELETLCAWAYAEADEPQRARLQLVHRAAGKHIDRARAAARHRAPYRSFTGALFEAANSNCDAAEADLLRMAPDTYLLGQLPSLIDHVTRHLPPSDPRLREFDKLRADLDADGHCSERARTQLIAVARAASSAAAREYLAVHRFRNVLILSAAVLTVIAVSIAVLGVWMKEAVPLCFVPQRGQDVFLVCPAAETVLQIAGQPARPELMAAIRAATRDGDLATVELLGAVAGAVTAAVGLQGLRAGTGAFGLPVALALLKMPFGALTAFIGLLLMRGQFIPGLSALDSSAQILAWAVLFGSSQQIFTRLVDQQARAVVGRVRGARRATGDGGHADADDRAPPAGAGSGRGDQ